MMLCAIKSQASRKKRGKSKYLISNNKESFFKNYFSTLYSIEMADIEHRRFKISMSNQKAFI